MEYYNLGVEEVLKKVESNENGLKEEELAEIFWRYGQILIRPMRKN